MKIMDEVSYMDCVLYASLINCNHKMKSLVILYSKWHQCCCSVVYRNLREIKSQHSVLNRISICWVERNIHTVYIFVPSVEPVTEPPVPGCDKDCQCVMTGRSPIKGGEISEYDWPLISPPIIMFTTLCPSVQQVCQVHLTTKVPEVHLAEPSVELNSFQSVRLQHACWCDRIMDQNHTSDVDINTEGSVVIFSSLLLRALHGTSRTAVCNGSL